MRKDYTDITIVMDRSGSMISIKADMEGGFNEFIANQRKVEGKATVTLVQFDNIYCTCYQALDVKEVPPMVLEPRGSTALYDAIGIAIDQTGQRLRLMREEKRPAKVVILIITDGQENASTRYSQPQVFDMIAHQKEKYNWEFIFLGADQDALETGASLGITKDYSMTFVKNCAGVNATYSSMNDKFTMLRSGEYVVGKGFFDAADRAAQAQAEETA